MNRAELVAKIGEALVAKLEALNVDTASANNIDNGATTRLHASLRCEDVDGDTVRATVFYDFDADVYAACEDLSSLDWTPVEYDLA